MTNHYDVIIVGGGIAGLATAVALLGGGRAGTPPPRENCSSSSSCTVVPPLRLAVLERATKLRPVGAALGLFPNGLNALQAISPTVHDKVLESCIPATVMYVRDAADPQKILQQMGGQTSQQDNSSSNNNNKNKDNGKETPQKQQQEESKAGTSSSSSGGNSSSVGVGGVHMMVWYLLQQYLQEELPCNVVRLGTSVEAVEILQPPSSSSSPSSTNHHNDDENNNNNNDPAQIKVTTLNRVTGEKETLYCHVLIGADGIHSTVRQTLWPKRNNKLLYHNKLMFRAVMECKLLDAKYCPSTGEQLAYQGQVAGKLFAFRETSAGLLTFTSMANFDNDEEPNFGATAAERKARLQQLFCDYPDDVCHVLNHCPADAIYVNAVYDLEQVVDQWSRECVVLIGDAAHAMTPGMGQGANMGLEDAAELAYFVLKTLKTHHRHNGDGENTSSSSSWPSAAIMASTLEEFWKSRIDRVKMVHQGSRLRTLMNNQASSSSSSSSSSSKTTNTDNKNDDSNNKGVALLYTQNQDIREQVHGWKPSIREEAEEET